MDIDSRNVTWQPSNLTRHDRQRLSGHRGYVLWFTGLPGSGKSTLAFALEKELYARNIASYVLDGDNIRHGLSRDLGFSEDDRKENIRRVGEVSKLFVDAGLIVLVALVSPSRSDRRMVRAMFGPGDFMEIYVNCPLAECEKRDPKGLYKKARSGQIQSFTGVGASYDIPASPELVLNTQKLTVAESVSALIRYLEDRSCLE
ncbi:adenylyl-sulfate kinase [Cohnella faecalis]|uniref:Adenylyl-sulfate kinase n=1 Tax=Cohnella faecalis TaxID=2315694 RepID=A0A398CT84_9BACL|nr:adenylyl-sulfate kinase [Cohnella faecalis]RIE05370.1 adenylyl-sulfate kinase [Cohnella faecalis]